MSEERARFAWASAAAWLAMLAVQFAWPPVIWSVAVMAFLGGIYVTCLSVVLFKNDLPRKPT